MLARAEAAAAAAPGERGGLSAGKHAKHPQRTCEALARQVSSVVRYGTAPSRFAAVATGNRTCYASDDYFSGTLHTARALRRHKRPAPTEEHYHVPALGRRCLLERCATGLLNQARACSC